MILNVLTPNKKIVVDAEIDEVQVPAYRGELDILPDHTSLVTTLSTGVLRYKLKGDPVQKKAAISWGYLEIVDNNVNILAETAETPEQIDYQRAKVALENAEQAMLNAEDLEKQARKAERARARLELTKGN